MFIINPKGASAINKLSAQKYRLNDISMTIIQLLDVYMYVYMYEAYHLTAATCPERVFVHSPVSTFHTRRVASREPLTTTKVQEYSVWVYYEDLQYERKS